MEGGFRLAKCHVVAKTQGYHLVFIWGSQIKFQGGWTGLKGHAWCYTGFEEFLYQLLVPVKQGLVSRSNGGGFRLAKCHVVAKTHGYLMVFIWGSYIKFQGKGGLD